MTDPAKAAAIWKRMLAVMLDFFTVFIVGGMAIARVSGDTTSTGFNLDGLPALFLFALIPPISSSGGATSAARSGTASWESGGRSRRPDGIAVQDRGPRSRTKSVRAGPGVISSFAAALTHALRVCVVAQDVGVFFLR